METATLLPNDFCCIRNFNPAVIDDFSPNNSDHVITRFMSPPYWVGRVVKLAESGNYRLNWFAEHPVQRGLFLKTDHYFIEREEAIIPFKNGLVSAEERDFYQLAEPTDFKDAINSHQKKNPSSDNESLEKRANGPSKQDMRATFHVFTELRERKAKEVEASETNEVGTGTIEKTSITSDAAESNENQKLETNSIISDNSDLNSQMAKEPPKIKRKLMEGKRRARRSKKSKYNSLALFSPSLTNPDDKDVLSFSSPYWSKSVPKVGENHQVSADNIQAVVQIPRETAQEEAIAIAGDHKMFMKADLPSLSKPLTLIPLTAADLEAYSEEWSQAEKTAFEKGLYSHSTQFDKISRDLLTQTKKHKSTRVCVQYFYDTFKTSRAYYMWKKQEMARLDKLERQRREIERQKVKEQRRLRKKQLISEGIDPKVHSFKGEPVVKSEKLCNALLKIRKHAVKAGICKPVPKIIQPVTPQIETVVPQVKLNKTEKPAVEAKPRTSPGSPGKKDEVKLQPTPTSAASTAVPPAPAVAAASTPAGADKQLPLSYINQMLQQQNPQQLAMQLAAAQRQGQPQAAASLPVNVSTAASNTAAPAGKSSTGTQSPQIAASQQRAQNQQNLQQTVQQAQLQQQQQREQAAQQMQLKSLQQLQALSQTQYAMAQALQQQNAQNQHQQQAASSGNNTPQSASKPQASPTTSGLPAASAANQAQANALKAFGIQNAQSGTNLNAAGLLSGLDPSGSPNAAALAAQLNPAMLQSLQAAQAGSGLNPQNNLAQMQQQLAQQLGQSAQLQQLGAAYNAANGGAANGADPSQASQYQLLQMMQAKHQQDQAAHVQNYLHLQQLGQIPQNFTLERYILLANQQEQFKNQLRQLQIFQHLSEGQQQQAQAAHQAQQMQMQQKIQQQQQQQRNNANTPNSPGNNSNAKNVSQNTGDKDATQSANQPQTMLHNLATSTGDSLAANVAGAANALTANQQAKSAKAFAEQHQQKQSGLGLDNRKKALDALVQQLEHSFQIEKMKLQMTHQQEAALLQMRQMHELSEASLPNQDRTSLLKKHEAEKKRLVQVQKERQLVLENEYQQNVMIIAKEKESSIMQSKQQQQQQQFQQHHQQQQQLLAMNANNLNANQLNHLSQLQQVSQNLSAAAAGQTQNKSNSPQQQQLNQAMQRNASTGFHRSVEKARDNDTKMRTPSSNSGFSALGSQPQQQQQQQQQNSRVQSRTQSPSQHQAQTHAANLHAQQAQAQATHQNSLMLEHFKHLAAQGQMPNQNPQSPQGVHNSGLAASAAFNLQQLQNLQNAQSAASAAAKPQNPANQNHPVVKTQQQQQQQRQMQNQQQQQQGQQAGGGAAGGRKTPAGQAELLNTMGNVGNNLLMMQQQMQAQRQLQAISQLNLFVQQQQQQQQAQQQRVQLQHNQAAAQQQALLQLQAQAQAAQAFALANPNMMTNVANVGAANMNANNQASNPAAAQGMAQQSQSRSGSAGSEMQQAGANANNKGGMKFMGHGHN